MTDKDREVQIEAARLSMTHALTPDCQRFWWGRMKELIAQRSQAQVTKLETERGLTKVSDKRYAGQCAYCGLAFSLGDSTQLLSHCQSCPQKPADAPTSWYSCCAPLPQPEACT